MTWKLQIPLLRCPFCRHWVSITTRGEWNIRRPTKEEIRIIEEYGMGKWKGPPVEDYPPSPNNPISRAPAREEAEE